MSTISVLSTELIKPEYTLLTDQERFESLAIKDIPVKQDIVTHDIQKYLALRGKLIPLEAAAKSGIASAVNTVRMMELFDNFSMDEPYVEAALIAGLDELIVDALIDAADKTAILAMGEIMMSKAEAPLAYGGLGLSGLTMQHYKDART